MSQRLDDNVWDDIDLGIDVDLDDDGNIQIQETANAVTQVQQLSSTMPRNMPTISINNDLNASEFLLNSMSSFIYGTPSPPPLPLSPNRPSSRRSPTPSRRRSPTPTPTPSRRRSPSPHPHPHITGPIVAPTAQAIQQASKAELVQMMNEYVMARVHQGDLKQNQLMKQIFQD